MSDVHPTMKEALKIRGRGAPIGDDEASVASAWVTKLRDTALTAQASVLLEMLRFVKTSSYECECHYHDARHVDAEGVTRCNNCGKPKT